MVSYCSSLFCCSFSTCHFLFLLYLKEINTSTKFTTRELAKLGAIAKATNEEDLLSLFNQYSDLMSPNSDWLSAEDAVFINEVSVEGISATYHIAVQQHATTALFDTNDNLLVMSQNIFSPYHKKPKLLKSNLCRVMYASGTDLGPIGQCYLTFQ